MTEVIVIDSRDGVVCPHAPHVDGQGPGLCLRVVLPDVGEVLKVVKTTYKQRKGVFYFIKFNTPHLS